LPTLDEALKSLEEDGPLTTPAPRSDGPRPGNGGGPIARSTDAIASARGSVSSNGGATMRLVEPAARSEPIAPPVIEEPAPTVPVNSIEDIIALAEKQRDMQFKIMVKNCVRLVSIKPGRLEINLTENAPKTLLTDVSQRLSDWTGIRWMVSLSREQGSATINETETAKRDSLLSDARSDPDVAAILSRFPGAKIINVRIAAPAGQADGETIEGAATSGDTLAPIEEDD
jgi:DNA polymerase-3 subunit gamma/tau